MSKRWIGLIPCASLICAFAASCGSSDGGGGGSSGVGGNAGAGMQAEGGDAGAEHSAGAAGSPEMLSSAGAGGSTAAAGSSGAGAGGDLGAAVGGSAGGGADDGGAAGFAGTPVDHALSPAAIPNLAFWMDGNATSFSDLDANYPTQTDSGRIRSIPETPPLTGTWTAPTSDTRPVRERGALFLKPIETATGYYLQDSAATVHTDDSTLAISFRLLGGSGNPAQGGISGAIGITPQSLGLVFIGDGVIVSFNHSGTTLKRRLPRAAHVTMIVRFTATGVDVQYDIDGFRASESIAATIGHETASNFVLGFDPSNAADMYGYVSQVVGVDRAVSDAEESGLMDWLTRQPIPDAFPVTKPLIAILGDSIANGDQAPGWQRWTFRMLADLSVTNPDPQLLNAAESGGGVPKVKNSSYSDVVLPWYSAQRAKNILFVAAGSNDLAGGNNLQDLLDRYYALLDSARATGWKPIACTVLPRSDANLALGLAGFEAERQAFNADIVAHWADHAAALADVAAIPGMGAQGDSDNTAYYGADKIHPTGAGHGLLEPAYRAAVASVLNQ